MFGYIPHCPFSRWTPSPSPRCWPLDRSGWCCHSSEPPVSLGGMLCRASGNPHLSEITKYKNHSQCLQLKIQLRKILYLNLHLQWQYFAVCTPWISLGYLSTYRTWIHPPGPGRCSSRWGLGGTRTPQWPCCGRSSVTARWTATPADSHTRSWRSSGTCKTTQKSLTLYRMKIRRILSNNTV